MEKKLLELEIEQQQEKHKGIARAGHGNKTDF